MTDVLREREQTSADAGAPSGRKEITADRYLSTEILSKNGNTCGHEHGYTLA